MDKEQAQDEAIKQLNTTLDKLYKKLESLLKSIYGDPDVQAEGFKRSLEGRLTDLEKEIHETALSCQALVRSQEIATAERRGMSNLIKYTGVTSAATLVTLILVIYQSGVLGGA